MHIEPRLLVFTKGVRLRIAGAVAIGLLAVGLGIARLGLLGWLIGQVFMGRPLSELVLPVVLIAAVMVLRGAAEHWRAVVAHETAARVQKALRRTLYEKVAALGPGTVGRQRSGGLTLSMIDGVEQLETYFGQFLPQFLIALLSPLLIFAVVSFIDLPVALVMLGFALLALFAPALWHKWDVRASIGRMNAYKSFAAEFLDSIQGLATLKAFGQGKARADKLEVEARDLFRRTMWVLGTNSLARGITDASIAGGAAAALIYGASRVEAGAMSLTSLLIIMMLGIEIFRPMRELRTVLHQPRRASTASSTTRRRSPMPCRRSSAWRSRPRSLSRTCALPIPARAAPCMTASPSPPRRASGWGWSAPRAAASRRSCACCCASMIRMPAASPWAGTTCARSASSRSAR